MSANLPSPLCPSDCGFPMDLQHANPQTWWCGWCLQYFDGGLKLMPGGNQRPARLKPGEAKEEKVAKRSTPVRIAPPVFDNGFPEDFPPED